MWCPDGDVRVIIYLYVYFGEILKLTLYALGEASWINIIISD